MPDNNLTAASEGVEVVILGSFNPGIFHPTWFLLNEIIDKKESESPETKVQVVGREVTEIHLCGIKITCLNDRFMISSNNVSQAARIEDMLFQIFALLTHIPVTACGINAHAFYMVGTRDHWHKIGNTLVPKDLIWRDLVENPGMRSVTILSRREGQFPGEINLTVEPSYDPRFDPAIFIRSNYDYQLGKQAELSKSVEAIVQFLKSDFEVALQFPKKTASMILERIKA